MRPASLFEAQLNAMGLGGRSWLVGNLGQTLRGFKEWVALFQAHTILYIHEEDGQDKVLWNSCLQVIDRPRRS
jgi:hypothetical protein